MVQRNQIIADSDRFYHAMILHYDIKIRNRDPVKLAIGGAQIKATKTVKLPGITVGNKLNF